MKRMIAAAVVAFAVCAAAYDGLYLPVYSYAKSDAGLHVREFPDSGRRWDFPAAYTGHRSVCWLPGASSNMAFTAWVGGDVWQPGDPFGFTPAASPSNTQAIALTKATAITPRIELGGARSSDRVVVSGSADYSGMTNPPDINQYHVRVVRYKYNSTSSDHNPEQSVGANSYRVVLDGRFDLDVRDFLHEGDLVDGVFDLDWDFLSSDLGSRSGFSTCASVSYAVLMGDDTFNQSSSTFPTNVVAHPLLVTRRFERVHTVPTAVSCTTNAMSAAFAWRIDGEDAWASAFGTTYTAFCVRVYDTGENVLHDTGYRRMPPVGMDGTYRWTAPAEWLADRSSWATWRVFTYNAKFKADDVGSSASGFTTR